jgi:hypothetical protein
MEMWPRCIRVSGDEMQGGQQMEQPLFKCTASPHAPALCLLQACQTLVYARRQAPAKAKAHVTAAHLQ